MVLRILLSAAVLALSPTLALARAEGCSHDTTEAAANCIDGFIWDPAAQTCVEAVSS